ncbi:MAG: ankyrin repeat domain-containing protein [Steroidobacteraceae bacterium]
MAATMRIALLALLLPAFAQAQTLLEAARKPDVVTALKLIGNGADVRAKTSDGTTALHWAAHHGELELVRRLLKAGADANARNDYGSSPMQEAAIRGDAAILSALLTAGAKVESANDDGETVLMTVARTGKVDAAKVLVKAGANVNAVESWRGQAALMWAASQRQPEMVRLLLQAGANPNAVSALRNWARTSTAEPRPQWRPPGAFTALQLAAREGCAACARELVKGGAEINAASPEGITALLFAVLNAWFDTAKVLIEAGADVNMADKWGRAPLYSAIDYNTTPRGGRPDRPSPDVATPLEIAAMLLDRKADIDLQLKAFPPYRLLGPDRGGDSLLTTGSTPLLRAAKACDVPSAKLLIERRAKVDLANSLSLTPLLVVAGSNWAITDTRGRFRNEKQCIEMARLLLDAGANIDAANNNGQTALHAAARMDMKDFVRFIAERGASLEVKDRNGSTALDIAEGRTGTAARPGASGPEKHPAVAAVLHELMDSKPAR